MKIEIDYHNNKKINKRKIVFAIAGIILIIFIVTIVLLYSVNNQFKDFIDTHILRKNLSENDGISIEIDAESSQHILAYSNTIGVLEKNTLTQYNSSGKKEKSINLEINNPIYDAKDQYLVIAEKNRQKVYMLESGNIKWEKNIEGNIKNVHINKNGYVGLIITGTTYKSVISILDPEGKELFKTYLSTTIAVDVEISYDNKFVSFAEVNTTGTLIQSTIKTISVEKAKQTPSDSIINTYTEPTDDLILSIKYQDKNKLICCYENSIHILDSGKDEILLQLDNKEQKNRFADIELENYIFYIREVNSGLFKADNIVEFINISTQKNNNYVIEGVAKEVYSCENIIAVNLGSEVYIIDTNGWLVKKYTSTQEIRNIVLNKNIAGIVYRDKIEIITW